MTTSVDQAGAPYQVGIDLNVNTIPYGVETYASGQLAWTTPMTSIILGPGDTPTVAWVECVDVANDACPAGEGYVGYRGPYVAQWDGTSWNMLGGELETDNVTVASPFIGCVGCCDFITVCGPVDPAPDGPTWSPYCPLLATDGTNIYVAYLIGQMINDSTDTPQPCWYWVIQYWDGSAWTPIARIANLTNNGCAESGQFPIGAELSAIWADSVDPDTVWVSFAETGPPLDGSTANAGYWTIQQYALDGTLLNNLAVIAEPSATYGAGSQGAFVRNAAGTLFYLWPDTNDPDSTIGGAAAYNLYSLPGLTLYPLTTASDLGPGFYSVADGDSPSSVEEFLVNAYQTGSAGFSTKTPDGTDDVTNVSRGAIEGLPAVLLPDSVNPNNVWLVTPQNSFYTTEAEAIQVKNYTYVDCETPAVQITPFSYSGAFTGQQPMATIDAGNNLIYVSAVMNSGAVQVWAVPISRDVLCGSGSNPYFHTRFSAV